MLTVANGAQHPAFPACLNPLRWPAAGPELQFLFGVHTVSGRNVGTVCEAELSHRPPLPSGSSSSSQALICHLESVVAHVYNGKR